MCVRACVHACMCACVHARTYTRMCVCVCARACVRACLLACVCDPQKSCHNLNIVGTWQHHSVLLNKYDITSIAFDSIISTCYLAVKLV